MKLERIFGRNEMSETVADKFCQCGHRVKHYIDTEPDDFDKKMGFDLGLKIETDVIERDCPHRNGTVIQYCPRCDTQVGMWGCGVAGGMECACWECGE